jgi:hypothetical protein
MTSKGCAARGRAHGEGLTETLCAEIVSEHCLDLTVNVFPFTTREQNARPKKWKGPGGWANTQNLNSSMFCGVTIFAGPRTTSPSLPTT